MVLYLEAVLVDEVRRCAMALGATMEVTETGGRYLAGTVG